MEHEEGACSALLAILGVPGDGEEPATTGLLLRGFAFDSAHPSAIEGALLAARTTARGAREVVSSEMWECLNVTWHTLPEQRRTAYRLGPMATCASSANAPRCSFGLADSTMSQDDGRRFPAAAWNGWT